MREFALRLNVLRAACVATLLAAHGVALAAPPREEANSLGMTLVLVPAGQYQRGTSDDFRLRMAHRNSIEIGDEFRDERPAHLVKISRPFRIAAHETTVGQFRAFVSETGYKTDAEKSARGALAFNPPDKETVDRFKLDANCTWRSPGFEQTDEHPVACVSWNDAVAFCEWLSKKEQARYRLPTEAEWEYAARAGSDTTYISGDAPESVYAFGNVGDAALEAAWPGTVKRQQTSALKPGDGDGVVFTAPVGKFKSNAWGLFDTHGNVWEWCSDRYYDRYYDELTKRGREQGTRGQPAPVVDPAGPETTTQHKYGDWRSMRGGCWYTAPLATRSAARAFGEAADAFCYTGFRVVREVPTPENP